MIEKKEVQQPEAVIQGPGQILKQARERLNLSSQDIAKIMKLRKDLIEDIEQDNYDINLSLTFVRGYLKLYAKHVQVSEVEVLNAFEKLSTQKKEPASLHSFSRRIANQANDDKLMIVTYLILAAVIALVVIWWFQQSSIDTSTAFSVSNYTDANTPDVVDNIVLPQEETSTLSDAKILMSATLDEDMTTDDSKDSDVTDIVEPEIPLPTVAEQNTIGDSSSSAELADDTSDVFEQTEETKTLVNEYAEPVELVFEFSGDCWMNLADATGENIAYGVKVAGRVMPVTGIPPFVVTLGAPEVVKISYAGEPLDMSFLPTGRIAKFDLPLSE